MHPLPLFSLVFPPHSYSIPVLSPPPHHNLTISRGLLQAIQSPVGSAPGYLFSLMPLTSHMRPAQQDYTTSISHQALLSRTLPPSSRKYYFLSLHSKSTFSQNYFLARTTYPGHLGSMTPRPHSSVKWTLTTLIALLLLLFSSFFSTKLLHFTYFFIPKALQRAWHTEGI